MDLLEAGEHPVDQHELGMHAWAAGRVYEHKPRHLWDVGSDTLWLATISQFCPVTALDIRHWQSRVAGLQVRMGTVTALPYDTGVLPFVSCLSVVEHVGLGRYGDPLDPLGTRKACAELMRVLAPGGHLLLAVPIGREPGVVFSAHRIFSRDQILSYLPASGVVSEVALFPEPDTPARAATLGEWSYAMYCVDVVKGGR